MTNETILWLVFAVLVPAVLILDLGVFHRKAHAEKTREALLWSAFWISLALLYAVAVYFMLGREKGFNFLTAYVVEESLSMDNLFVFMLLFSTFCVPAKYQHRVLFWGIVGAMVMRALFIFTGLVILEKLHWVIYIFGAFLVYTGIKMSMKKEQEIDPRKNIFLRLACRYLPVHESFVEGRFFTRLNGKLMATPLFLVLIVVESTDVVFAVDSIPAVLAISHDPFIVYTSNIFAILGLRSLFFAIAGATRKLKYLSYGLSAILVFLGAKMLGSGFFKVPVAISLSVVIGILALSAIASVIWRDQTMED
jgi:tellurite resistance protein TerC